jgi:excisionase family DNA binding protein
MKSPPQKLVSTKQLAEKYGVHPRTVQKWVNARIIPAIKITKRCMRFDEQECADALGRLTTR